MASIDVREIFEDPSVAELAEAITAKDDARVRQLVPKVDLAARGDQNVTLLEWALLNQNVSAMNILLDAGADPAQTGVDDSTVVHMAAAANDPVYLETLLSHGANPNVPDAGNGATPLSSALMGDRTDQFKMLLAAGADPDHPDRGGNTALHVAGLINRPQRAMDLLEAGANAAAKNAQNATFEEYLFVTDPELLNDEKKRELDALVTWLRAHPTQGADG